MKTFTIISGGTHDLSKVWNICRPCIWVWHHWACNTNSPLTHTKNFACPAITFPASDDTQSSGWHCGSNHDTATQKRTLTGGAKYHCIHCNDATPVHWRAAVLHTDRGRNQISACNASTTTTATENNLPRCYDPTLIIQVTTMSPPGDRPHPIACQHANAQGVEETMTLVQKQQPHVFSQSKLWSCSPVMITHIWPLAFAVHSHCIHVYYMLPSCYVV